MYTCGGSCSRNGHARSCSCTMDNQHKRERGSSYTGLRTPQKSVARTKARRHLASRQHRKCINLKWRQSIGTPIEHGAPLPRLPQAELKAATPPTANSNTPTTHTTPPRSPRTSSHKKMCSTTPVHTCGHSSKPCLGVPPSGPTRGCPAVPLDRRGPQPRTPEPARCACSTADALPLSPPTPSVRRAAPGTRQPPYGYPGQCSYHAPPCWSEPGSPKAKVNGQ